MACWRAGAAGTWTRSQRWTNLFGPCRAAHRRGDRQEGAQTGTGSRGLFPSPAVNWRTRGGWRRDRMDGHRWPRCLCRQRLGRVESPEMASWFVNRATAEQEIVALRRVPGETSVRRRRRHPVVARVLCTLVAEACLLRRRPYRPTGESRRHCRTRGMQCASSEQHDGDAPHFWSRGTKQAIAGETQNPTPHTPSACTNTRSICSAAAHWRRHGGSDR